jgi:hypothetical protein
MNRLPGSRAQSSAVDVDAPAACAGEGDRPLCILSATGSKLHQQAVCDDFVEALKGKASRGI